MCLNTHGAVAFINEVLAPIPIHGSMPFFPYFKVLQPGDEGVHQHRLEGGFGLEVLSTLVGDDSMALPPIDLAVFHDNGYVRKQCSVTNCGFDIRP